MIKIGIIGCGKQAPKHIGALKPHGDVELVLCDIDSSLAQALGEEHDLPWVESVDQILDDPSVTAIDVCTPVTSHTELILAGLDRGKDFFCEKPLCQTAEEARTIEARVAETGQIGMVGFNYRFAPAMEEAGKILAEVPNHGSSAVIGPVTSAFFRLGGRGGHQLWKHQAAAGGGAINEMLIHSLDLVNWFLGPIETAELVTQRVLRPNRPIAGTPRDVDAEDFVLVRVVCRNGIEAFCHADLVTPAFMHYVEVQGENGTFFGSIQPDMPSFLFCEKASGGYTAGRTRFDFGPRNFFDAQMSKFILSLRERTQPTGCAVSDSVILLEAFEQIRSGSTTRG